MVPSATGPLGFTLVFMSAWPLPQVTARLIQAQDAGLPVICRGEVEVKGKGRMVSVR